jgi:uncharacterized membrane protein YgcG
MIVEPSSFVVAIIIVVIIVFICGYFYFLSTNQGTNFLDSATGRTRVSANSHHNIESIAQDRGEPISFCGLSSCDNDGGCSGGDGGGGGGGCSGGDKAYHTYHTIYLDDLHWM